jgi:hypothetical protein
MFELTWPRLRQGWGGIGTHAALLVGDTLVRDFDFLHNAHAPLVGCRVVSALRGWLQSPLGCSVLRIEGGRVIVRLRPG